MEGTQKRGTPKYLRERVVITEMSKSSKINGICGSEDSLLGGCFRSSGENTSIHKWPSQKSSVVVDSQVFYSRINRLVHFLPGWIAVVTRAGCRKIMF